MKNLILTTLLLLSISTAFTQPNNLCGNATVINSGGMCSTTTGTMSGATWTAFSGSCGGGTQNDVWYRFTSISSQATIIITGLSNARFQVLTNHCSSPSSVFCSSNGSATFSGLTPGTNYLIRVYSSNNTVNTFTICVQQPAPTRMREVFRDEIIASNAANLNSPWEITYGPDGFLWVTESKNFLVRRLDPNTTYTSTPPASTIALDLTSATWPAGVRKNYTVNVPVNGTNTPDPQGGLMGLALHPEFNTNPAKRFVYVAYVRQYLGQNQTYAGETVNGHLFINNLVRFTYNTGTGQLESPVILCDTLRGSNDHNSGRMIIAPVNGVSYLFYAEGDMGAGQFANLNRIIKSQHVESYEGKMLRFNLEPDGDAPQETVNYNQWIPNDNPYNDVAPVTGQSAVYNIGHRNIQGLAFINDKIFAASHGPYSDDEVNLLESGKNYGHPLVIGYSNDGNYNNAKAGPISSSSPSISNESSNASSLTNYKDPLYSFFAPISGNTTSPWSIQYIYNNTASAQSQVAQWPSIAPSGMEAYNHTLIPGWKNSLLLASLKKGYTMRIKPNTAGTGVESIDGSDTAVVFNTQNRFRELAINSDGKTLYAIVDRSGSTSSPSSSNPVNSACAGCIIKYTFLGYNHDGTTSTIPSGIPIDAGTPNSCATGTTVTINAANNNTNLWVPITGPDGNVIAEINANGNNLGIVTSSFFVRNGSPRSMSNGLRYLNRNITITPQFQPATPVSVRLYVTVDELSNLISQPGSMVTTITDLGIFKKNDACGSNITGIPTGQVITGRYTQGTFGHALQTNISSFSTFYFASANASLPFNLVRFTADPRNSNAVLQWTLSNEENTENILIERSLNSADFSTVGTVAAKGNTVSAHDYQFTDWNAAQHGSSIFYRLKITEKDGSFRYSGIRQVKFRNQKFIVSVSPNPASSVVNLRIFGTGDETAQLRIFDNTGRVVHSRTVQLLKGDNNLQLDVSKLGSGLYYIDITGKTFNSKNKLMKQ